MIPAQLLTPPALIIASVILVSALGWLVPSVKNALILIPERVRSRGEVHRLLTAGWLHGDANHLILNLLMFHVFAASPLRLLGPVWFVVFYVSAVVVAFIPTTLRQMKNRRYASLGASGAVSAIMFSAILLEPGMRLSLYFLPIRLPAVAFAVIYLGYSVWSSYRNRDGVNHDAHFAGALYGAC